MNFRIVFFLLFVSIVGYGQTNYIKKTADDFYKKERYLEAIEFYEKLVVTKKADPGSLKNLATAYQRIRHTDKAESIWNMLILSGDKSEEVLFQYAFSLASNGKYEMAKMYFQQVLTLNPSNKRALKFYDGFCNLSNYYADSSNCKLYYPLFNSTHSEFSPILYKDKLVFVSSRANSLGVQRVFEYNNTPFLDLYVVDTSSIQKKSIKGLIFNVDEDLKHKKKIAVETSNDTKSSVHLSPTLHSEELKNNDKKYGVKLFSKDLSSSYHEGSSVFAEEEEMLYFTGNNFKSKIKRGTIKPLSIHEAISNGKGGYKKATELSFANSAYSIAHPAISSDGTILYFSSDMPGGAGGMDLYKSIKAGKEWSAPVNLTALNTEGDEVFPYIYNDELLFFASNGNGGLGGLDILYTRIDDFSSVKNPGSPINSSKDDFGICVYENGKRGYISSNRIKHGEDDDIYYFESSKKFEIEKAIKEYGDSKVVFKGSIRDKKDSAAIKTMIAVFYQSEDNLVELKNSDDSGAFSFYLHEDARYIIKIADSDYYIVTDSVITKSNKFDINKTYYLERNTAVANIDSVQKKLEAKVSKMTFYGKVFDADDKRPLESIVKITNPSNTSLDDITISDTDGSFSFSMSTSGKYTIDILCEEYQLYTAKVEFPDSAVVHKYFNLSKINSSYDSLKNVWVPEKEKGIFKGKILTQPGNLPLSDLVVLYHEGDTIQDDFTISGFEGEFDFKVLKGINYTLVAIDKELGKVNYSFMLPKKDSILEATLLFKSITEKKVDLDSMEGIHAFKDSLYNSILKSIVVDSASKAPVDAMVAISQELDGEPEEVTVCDFDGNFEIKIRKEGVRFLRLESKGYDKKTIKIDFAKESKLPSRILMSRSAEFLKVDSALLVNRKIVNEKTTLFGRIETFEGKEPMLSLVAFYDKAGGEPLLVLPSDENGFFSCQLERSKVYMVEILEVGYLPYQEFLTMDDTSLIRKEVFRIKQPIKESVYKAINEKIAEQVSHIDENNKLIEEKVKYENVIKGFVFEKEDYIPIAARVILLNSENGKIIKDTIASIKGAFQFYVTEQLPYKILVEAEGYYSETFFSRGNTFNKSQLILFLNKIPHFRKVIKKLPPTPIAFSGKIQDAKNLLPLKAILGLYDKSSNTLMDVIYADRNGLFKGLLVPGKNYLVKIAYSDYDLINDPIVFNKDITAVYKEYYLVKNYNSKSVDSLKQKLVPLVAKNLVNGIVLDKRSNEPIDAIVKITSVKDPSQYFLTMSDFDGVFSQNVESEGTYTIDIIGKGYKASSFTKDISILNSADQATIYLDKVSTLLDSLELQWASKIRGRLVGNIKRFPTTPLSSFVILLPENATIAENYTLSDFDGNYSIPIKKNIPYTVLVQDADYGDKIGKVLLNEKDSMVLYNVVYLSDSIRNKYKFDSLATTYRILKNKLYTQLESIVYDSKTKMPLKSMVVLRTSPQAAPEEVLITESYGEICLQVPKDKKWYLTIQSEGYVSKEIVLPPSGNIEEKIFLDRVKENTRIDSLYNQLTLKMKDNVILKGIIKDSLINQSEPALVALYEDGKTTPLEVHQAQKDGTFSFVLDRNKKYRIEVVKNGNAPIVQSIATFNADKILFKSIQFENINKKAYSDSLIAQLGNSASELSTVLYGVVYDASNRPQVLDILIMDKDMSQILEHTTSDFEGRYAVSVPKRDGYLVKLMVGFLKHSEVVPNKGNLSVINKNFFLKGKNGKPGYNENQSIIANNSNKVTGKEKMVSTGFKENPTSGMTSIVFGVNRNTINTSQFNKINGLKKILQADTSLRLDIIGHADNSGSVALNKKLSLRRADAVKRYLVAQKIAAKRLRSFGKGEELPVVSNTTYIGRSVNRRVDYKLYKNDLDSIPMIYASKGNFEYNLKGSKWSSKLGTKVVKEIIVLLASDPKLSVTFSMTARKQQANKAVIALIESKIIKGNESFKERIKFNTQTNKKYLPSSVIVEVYFNK